MNLKKVYLALIIIAAFIAGAAVYSGITLINAGTDDGETLYQIMPYGAMASGIYSGNTTLSELRKHGNFGIGAYNDMDGEMVELDGKFYQIKVDGAVYQAADTSKTPYAQVTYFEADVVIDIHVPMNYSQVIESIDQLLPTENMFYAIKITGNYDLVNTRSVPKQLPPYPPLSEVVKNQTVFNYENINGVAMGFRCPSYAGSAVFPGYHLHFLSIDKEHGGHLLEFIISAGTVEVDVTPNFEIASFSSSEFNEYHHPG